MVDHITTSLQSLLVKYPKSGILIVGDRNLIHQKDLLTVDTSQMNVGAPLSQFGCSPVFKLIIVNLTFESNSILVEQYVGELNST